MTRHILPACLDPSDESFSQWLALVTLDTEVIGVLGRGFPTSFYRIHVLAGERWYGLENKARPALDKGDEGHPILGRNGSLKLAPDQRCAVVWGRLCHLLSGYQTKPEGRAMAALLERGREMALHDPNPRGAA